MVTKLEPLFKFDTTKTFVKPGKTTSLVFRTKMHEEELRDLVDNARRHGGSYEVMHEALNGKKVWVKLADGTYHLATVRGGDNYWLEDEEAYWRSVYVEYANEDEATMIGESYNYRTTENSIIIQSSQQMAFKNSLFEILFERGLSLNNPQ